jgi:hypothetical protein
VTVHDLLMESERWDGLGTPQKRSWRHLVLTMRAQADLSQRFDEDLLRRQVRRARSAVQKFWRSTEWGRQVRDEGARRKRSRRDTSYILAEEVSPNGMVHIHALIYGEYIDQKVLQSLWSRAIGDSGIVYVRTVNGESGVGKALREVLKYATKGEKGTRAQPRNAAAVELAFRNVHRVSLGGAVRKVRVADDHGATDDVRANDLHHSRTLSCEVCGAVGRWKWVQIRAARDVEEFGGFGLIASPIAIESLWSG